MESNAPSFVKLWLEDRQKTNLGTNTCSHKSRFKTMLPPKLLNKVLSMVIAQLYKVLHS